MAEPLGFERVMEQKLQGLLGLMSQDPPRGNKIPAAAMDPVVLHGCRCEGWLNCAMEDRLWVAQSSYLDIGVGVLSLGVFSFLCVLRAPCLLTTLSSTISLSSGSLALVFIP
jgi:hypothetical protein